MSRSTLALLVFLSACTVGPDPGALSSLGDDGKADGLGDGRSTVSLHAVALAECDRRFACGAFIAGFTYLSEDECAAVRYGELRRQVGLPGVAFDPDAMWTCARELSALTCNQLDHLGDPIDRALPIACELGAGSLAVGDACHDDHQCATGSCARPQVQSSQGGFSSGGPADCGVCAEPLPLGTTCLDLSTPTGVIPANGDRNCGLAAECTFDKAAPSDPEAPPSFTCLAIQHDPGPFAGAVPDGAACTTTADCAGRTDGYPICVASEPGGTTICQRATGHAGDACQESPDCDFAQTGLECAKGCDFDAFIAEFTDPVTHKPDFAAAQQAMQTCLDGPGTCAASDFKNGRVDEACGVVTSGTHFHTVDCATGLYCRFADATSQAGTCAAQGTVGQACAAQPTEAFGAPCRAGLECRDAVCLAIEAPVCRAAM